MPHPLVLALFSEPSAAATAARALRALGVPRERVSIVARSHDEEGVIAKAADASPGAEIDDSRQAGRLAELSAHFIAAMALVLPGVGPIVADGPLAAELGEAAGHLAGGIARTLVRAGMSGPDAEEWESQIENGAVLLGAHTEQQAVAAVQENLTRSGALGVKVGRWED
jgi:hypothetical protein